MLLVVKGSAALRRRLGGRVKTGDAGFTLMELLTVITLIGIVSAIAVPSLRKYQASQQLISSTRDVVSLMRQSQASAVANSSTVRLDFAADNKSVTEYLAGSSGSYTQVASVSLPSGISFASHSFTARAGGTSTSLFFYSRGTATDGSVVLQRASGGTHTITVEGVTGRVAYS